MTLKTITQVALVTAVICLLSPIAIPIGPIPVTLSVFAIYLGVYILGMKKGTFACLLYLLIGLAGLPVFSGYTGGAAKLFGPTGGFLVGYLFLALISGFFIDRFYSRVPLQIAGMLLGLAVLYAFGTLWLAHQAGMTPGAAAAAAVWPFIGPDLLKTAAAVTLGRAVRNGLVRAGFIEKTESLSERPGRPHTI